MFMTQVRETGTTRYSWGRMEEICTVYPVPLDSGILWDAPQSYGLVPHPTVHPVPQDNGIPWDVLQFHGLVSTQTPYW